MNCIRGKSNVIGGKSFFLILISLSISLLISFLVSSGIFCITLWLHELGHLLSGLLLKIVLGLPNEIFVSNYTECFPGILVPQQVNTPQITIVALSGPLGVIVIGFSFAYVVRKKFEGINGKALFFIPGILSFHEVIDNVILGTDNPLFKPLVDIFWFRELVSGLYPALLIFPVAAVLYKPLKKFLAEKRWSALREVISSFWSRASRCCRFRP